MAKKQTRRSISVSRALFEQAKTAAELAGVSLSQYAEAGLRHQMSPTRLPDDAVANAPPPGMVQILLGAEDAQAFREWIAAGHARRSTTAVANDGSPPAYDHEVCDPVVEYDDPTL